MLSMSYNALLVLSGTMLLGASCGLMGVFLTLRRQVLLSDVISHAALPGVAMAFLLGLWLAPEKAGTLPWLVGGSMFASGVAVLICFVLQQVKPLWGEAAFGIPLGGFLALGVVFFSIIQQVPSGNAAGLEGLLFGRAAALSSTDVLLLGGLAGIVVIVCLLLRKELLLIAFDREFAIAQGLPVALLDTLLTGMTAAICVLALPMVGFLLVVALMVTPAAAARFWSDRLGLMIPVSVMLGMVSAGLGTLISGQLEYVPTGPAIVLCATMFFAISVCFGSSHGFIYQWWSHRLLKQEQLLDDLLRSTYEEIEAATAKLQSATMAPAQTGHADLPQLALDKRLIDVHPSTGAPDEFWLHQAACFPKSIPTKDLSLLKQLAVNRGYLRIDSAGQWRMTELGWQKAKAVVLRHRLLELYLIEHAEFPPAQGDRTADLLEHALGPHTVDELKILLRIDFGQGVIRSPHPLEATSVREVSP